MEFKEMLPKLLKEKNATAYKLAKATGISQGLLSDYKNGRSKPTIENIIKISKYFNVSTDYLLGNTDDPTPQNKKDLSNEIEKSKEYVKLLELADQLTPEGLRVLIAAANELVPKQEK